MSYTCIAIDDEFPATQVIESLVNKIPDLLLLKSFTKAKEALDYLHNNEVDIIFLDIQMPDLNGLEFVRSLRKKHKIILTTAYDQYALEGFNLEVVDYLLKPFSFDRFVVALNKAIRQIEFERNDLPIKQKNSREDFITVKSDYKLINIPFLDIDYIEGLKAYLSIFVNGKRIIVLDSLKNYELMLPEDQFLRVHKSYIVPLQKIKFMEGNMLVINEKKIPIGKSYKEIVLKKVFKM